MYISEKVILSRKAAVLFHWAKRESKVTFFSSYLPNQQENWRSLSAVTKGQYWWPSWLQSQQGESVKRCQSGWTKVHHRMSFFPCAMLLLDQNLCTIKWLSHPSLLFATMFMCSTQFPHDSNTQVESWGSLGCFPFSRYPPGSTRVPETLACKGYIVMRQ